ncbi:hypothetical protein G3260_000112 [Streptomyces albus]|uniref:hypothetical protein n=1 Tax=Streptomyces albus TaxID=1888 RepID=UPI0013B493F1|nr:hypothetical protein [Streptomyces albus]QID34341.1 hypothetical protein G3260_000112 [Streptomyces albus]
MARGLVQLQIWAGVDDDQTQRRGDRHSSDQRETGGSPRGRTDQSGAAPRPLA